VRIPTNNTREISTYLDVWFGIPGNVGNAN